MQGVQAFALWWSFWGRDGAFSFLLRMVEKVVCMVLRVVIMDTWWKRYIQVLK